MFKITHWEQQTHTLISYSVSKATEEWQWQEWAERINLIILFED